MSRVSRGALAAGLVLGLGLLGGMAPAATPIVTGVCTRIAPQSAFLDPIISRDPVMHYFDPIVYPGVYGYFTGGPHPFDTGTHGPAHWHNFFGNRSVNPNGLASSDAPTTCTGGFRGALWSPNLLGHQPGTPEGQYIPIPPRTMRYTYRGDVPAAYAAIARGALWDCGPGTPQTDVPHFCSSGTVQALVTFRFVVPVGIKMRVRSDFGPMQFGFDRLTVGGIPIAAQFPDGTWHAICNDSGNVRCEDERSFHVDVLFPKEVALV